MNVIVTGATSFIGAATVRKLLQHEGGQIERHHVTAVVRPGSRNRNHLQCQIPEERAGNLEIIELDLKKIQTISTGNMDVWIHIAWDGAGSDNRKNRTTQQENVYDSLNAVRAAAKLGCKRFIFTGSQAEYGIHHTIITEDTPLHPVSEYGKAKLEFSKQASELCESLGMEYVHARIFSVYGPGDHPWSLVQTCLSAWTRGEQMQLGACTQDWNFLYIEDMAEAMVHLLTEGQAGVYNIASKDTRQLREYIEEMYRLCGSQGSFVYGKRSPNAEGVADLNPDIGKILRETTWQPVTSFMEGINETMHSM